MKYYCRTAQLVSRSPTAY